MRHHLPASPRRHGLLACALFGLLLAACGRGTTAATDHLERAVSACEDLIEAELARDEAAADAAYGRLQTASTAVQLEPPARRTELATAVTALAEPMARHDLTATAWATADVYQLLVAASPETGAIPSDVDLLDLAGFRGRIVFSASPLDWARAGKVAAAAEQEWGRLRPRVTDHALTDLVDHTLRGMSEAAVAHDREAYGLAAQLLLDSVDLLEAFFTVHP